MLQNVFQLKADLKKKSTFVTTPEIVQNDNVRFEIEVTDNGKPLALDNVQTVSLAHSTKGETVVTSGEIEGNKVIFNLGTLETKYVGQVNATVQLYDVEGRISTIKFPYYVVADPTGKDYVPSEKEQTLIEVVMSEAQAKIDELSQVDVVDLKAKQDEFTVQLAQRALQSSLEVTNNNVTELELNKASKTELQEGLTSKMNRGESIKASQIDKNQGKFDQTFMTDEFLQQMAGNTPINSTPANKSLTSIKFAEKAVTNNKLNLPKSELLPLTFPFELGAINTTTGEAIDDQWNRRARTDFIRVSKGDVAEVVDKDLTDFAYALYNVEDMSFYTYRTWTTKYTFEGDYYVRFMQRYNDNRPNLADVDFEYFGNNLFIVTMDTVLPRKEVEEKLSTKLDNTLLTRSEKNLFDGNFRTGFVSGASPYAYQESTNGRNALIEVEPNTTYTITKSTDTDALRVVTFVDYPIQNSMPTSHKVDWTGKELTVTTGENDRYLLVVVSSSSQNLIPERLQIELGDTATEYEEPYVFKDSIIPQKGVSDVLLNHEILTDLTNLYKTTAPVIPTAQTDTAEGLYTLYDDLITNNPDYITRTLLGNEPSGLPIYRYDFKPPETNGKHPKILYISGMHPERSATNAGIRFFTDICTNWRTNNILQTLRWNVHFIVVPCLNPYGYNSNTRGNFNGVNLNRNFPLNWKPNPEATDYDRPGEAPLSEVESQLIDSLIKNEDLLFVIDNHNWSRYDEQNRAMWVGTMSKTNGGKIIAGIANVLNAELKKDYSYLDQGNTRLIDVLDYDNLEGWLYLYVNSLGIPSIILENSGDLGSNNDDGRTFATEAIGNIVVTAIKHLNNNIHKWF